VGCVAEERPVCGRAGSCPPAPFPAAGAPGLTGDDPGSWLPNGRPALSGRGDLLPPPGVVVEGAP
jgi:hypothetical protein